MFTSILNRSFIVLYFFLVSFNVALSPTDQLNSVTNGKRETQSCSSINNCSGISTSSSSSLKSKVIPDAAKDGPCAKVKDPAKLTTDCLICDYNVTCVYGQKINVTCHQNLQGAKGSLKVNREMICQYCYQTENSDHICSGSAHCRVNAAPIQHYLANCTAKSHVLCLGNRVFPKYIRCNWTRGYKWSTALILSITLGGFGVDRFYLGMWQEGIGKLFSFGGLGVWTIIDVVLIAIGYLGPADGSVYII